MPNAVQNPPLQITRAEDDEGHEEDDPQRLEDLKLRARRARMMRALKRFVSQQIQFEVVMHMTMCVMSYVESILRLRCSQTDPGEGQDCPEEHLNCTILEPECGSARLI